MHATRLKDGLTKRVLRQWLLQTVARCFKAWGAYVVARQLQREMGLGMSGDEEEGRPSSPLADGLRSVAAGIVTIPTLF